MTTTATAPLRAVHKREQVVEILLRVLNEGNGNRVARKEAREAAEEICATFGIHDVPVISTDAPWDLQFYSHIYLERVGRLGADDPVTGDGWVIDITGRKTSSYARFTFGDQLQLAASLVGRIGVGLYVPKDSVLHIETVK